MMRYDLINHLIKTYGLKSYLEIGLQARANNFDKIQCEKKISIDPDPNAEADFQMTSDDFFKYGVDTLRNEVGFLESIDIVFCDGLHHADQIRKDFENSLMILSPKFVVIHDCNPPKEQYTHVPRDSKMWWGDVYKFAVALTASAGFRVVDIDCGCGVFDGTKNKQVFLVPYDNTEWWYFDTNRKELLNLITYAQFLEMHQ